MMYLYVKCTILIFSKNYRSLVAITFILPWLMLFRPPKNQKLLLFLLGIIRKKIKSLRVCKTDKKFLTQFTITIYYGYQGGGGGLSSPNVPILTRFRCILVPTKNSILALRWVQLCSDNQDGFWNENESTCIT